MSDSVRIGLISDTHGLVRPGIAEAFAGVSLIVHAGDVGRSAVLDSLARIAPVDAVFGNVDDVHDPRLARERTVPVGGLTLHVSHGHEFGHPTPTLLAGTYVADIIVFGHTHQPVIATETRAGRHVLIVNPGAAGPRRFDLQPTVAVLTVTGGRAAAEIVKIG